MKVPLTLRRRADVEPATALLLPSHDLTALCALCARVSADVLPRVYRVAEGYLVVPPQPIGRAGPGAIRLRALAPNLFVPADADLVPELAADEAAALTRERGLVFLPGGRAFAFDVRRPLAPADLVCVKQVRRGHWEPLPAPAPLAETLGSVTLDLPEQTPEAILETGGEGLAVETPRPEGAGPLDRTAGAVQMGAGKALVWLGKALRLRKLAGLGAKWVAGAVEKVPRLSESLLGKQEAALRALLKEFRDGNLERALRRALPLGGAGDRGAVVARDAGLPTHDTRFSLASLLAGPGGRVSLWLGGGDVQHLLAEEYRKAARDACRRGDYRRAAFIYGKLLREYPLAADALAQGGFHHEAALVYLKKVGNALRAAREFEAAGEVERALQIYRSSGAFESAGDLLRRVGEEEAAWAEYRRAAEHLANDRGSFLAAGELLLTKGGRPDVARVYFHLGWARRPGDDSLACGLRLLRLHAEEQDLRGLLALVGEADELFAKSANEHTAGKFYNELARLSENGHLAAQRDELRDRALLGLAAQLRQRTGEGKNPGLLLTNLFNPDAGWSPALLSDASHAAEAVRGPRPARRLPARVPLVRGRVTAVTVSADTGAVFLGTEDGQTAGFELREGTRLVLPARTLAPWPVTALAADPTGELLIALRLRPDGGAELTSYTTRGTTFVESTRSLDRDRFGLTPLLVEAGGPNVECFGLTPLLMEAGEPYVGVWDGLRLEYFLGTRLLPVGRSELPLAGETSIAFLVSRSRWGMPGTDLFFTGERDLFFKNPEFPNGVGLEVGWAPGPPPSPLRLPVLSRLQRSSHSLELAGVGHSGQACRSLLRLEPNGRYVTVYTGRTEEGEYLAATLLGPYRMAAVRKSGIDWITAGAQRLAVRFRTEADLTGAVACFGSPRTGELLVVFGDGTLLRVPTPTW
jgi:hypothetical protein